jgi:hypothetical protein
LVLYSSRAFFTLGDLYIAFTPFPAFNSFLISLFNLSIIFICFRVGGILF